MTNSKPYRKSTFSSSGTCVEVAPIDGGVFVRDSKNPEGAELEFSSAEWTAFLKGVRANEFDF